MIRTPSLTMIRCESPAQVESIARANPDHERYSRSSHAASVTLGDTAYFWTAA